MFRKKLKLKQTYKEFVEQADEFLATNNFPVDDNARRMYATFIQHYGQSDDTVDPKTLAAMIRKSIANAHAFDLIQECVKKEKEAAKKKADDEAAQKAPESVEPKA